MARITVAAEDIRAGDEFYAYAKSAPLLHWTALEDAGLVSGHVEVLVQFVDGGTQRRGWDIGVEIEVERKGGA